MRSRYCAFALTMPDYLLSTWHESTRPASLELDENMQWRRLLIQETVAGGVDAADGAKGIVSFIAIGRGSDGRFEQRERSRFLKEGGRWYYVDGDVVG